MGRVVKEVFRPASHEARVMEAVERPVDFTSLTEDSRVAQLLLPDIVASGLAPTTALCYSIQFMHFKVWCQANRRSSMLATAESVALFLATMAIKKKTLPPVLDPRQPYASTIQYSVPTHPYQQTQ